MYLSDCAALINQGWVDNSEAGNRRQKQPPVLLNLIAKSQSQTAVQIQHKVLKEKLLYYNEVVSVSFMAKAGSL